MTVTVEEAQAEKRKCEEAIKVALQQFMDYTGLSVHDVILGFIDFYPVEGPEERRVDTVHLEVRL